jgi:hypothetical protein
VGCPAERTINRRNGSKSGNKAPQIQSERDALVGPRGANIDIKLCRRGLVNAAVIAR